MENTQNVILEFLKECEIIGKKEETLENIYIKRDKLIDVELYDNMEKAIKKIKRSFSTSCITSLQESMNTRQKWPLLNLIRQLLKINGFSMTPIRKSAGYNASGKKKYDRYFFIEFKDKNSNKDSQEKELNK